MSKPAVLCIVAHPDDIEFMMAGTMLNLGSRGWEMHYMTLCNGNCGTEIYDSDTIAAMRTAESQASCAISGAIYHHPISNDLELFYNTENCAKVISVIREVKPTIVLTQSPDDYMEDHLNTCRIAVSAAFCRGMTNAKCEPPRKQYQDDIVVYHAIPHGLMDPMRHLIEPEFYVNVEKQMDTKWKLLECHKSQKEWLDVSQGMDAYQQTMKDFMLNLGKRSGKFTYAEGFRRRSWLGFASKEWDPLKEALGEDYLLNPKYV